MLGFGAVGQHALGQFLSAPRIHPGAATLAGAGSLVCNANTIPYALLKGAGSLAVNAQVRTTGAATFAGTGRFGDQIVSESATFAGTGRFGDQIVPESATLAGAGSLSVNAQTRTTGAARFTGTGRFGDQIVSESATFA